MTRAALANLRRWWPELLAAALLTLISFAGQPDDVLFSVFCAIILAAGWGMCARHKRQPLHDKLDKVGKDVNDVLDILMSDTAAAGDTEQQDDRPHLRLVRHD